MDLNEYQKAAQKTAIYPGKGENLYYPALGLNGEAGEVADKIKKIMRDKGGEISGEDRMSLALELGDVLWYVADLAHEIGMTLEIVGDINIRKLTSRARRGMIGGEGDNR